MRRICLFLCFLLLLTATTGCVKTHVFSGRGADLSAEDLDAYLLQESDRLLMLMKTRFSKEYIRTLYSDEQIIDSATELLFTLVKTTSQAQKAYVITFDAYTNPLEYQYQHDGSPDMATTSSLPQMVLSNTVAVFGATQVAVTSILRYNEFTACPTTLSGRRAVVLLDFDTAAAVFSFSAESYGLACSAQLCRVPVEAGTTTESLALQMSAGGVSNRVEYSTAGLVERLNRSVEPQMIPLGTDDRSFDTFLTETSEEMADYLHVCRSSAYVSLFYGSTMFADLMKPVESAIPGPVQQTDTFLGLNKELLLAEFISDDDVSATVRELVSSMISYQTLGQLIMGRISETNTLALSSSLMIQRYYQPPGDFKPAAVLLRYSDKVGILVSYSEDHGVVTATAQYISLTESTLDQFASMLRQFATN